MSRIVNQVRQGVFRDSVALMRISRALAALPGVEGAAVMMGTPANRRILADARLLAAEGGDAKGGDLIAAVRAVDDDAAVAALDEATALLAAPGGEGGAAAGWRPRTLRTAIQALPGANLALISVPGDFAAAEARKALRRGLHVMIFSDNVALSDELALKREGRERGLLVMGPDCGTAIIGGVPLAFANEVPAGDIGIIGASGTGIQEVACLIARAGGGISHAIGVGGRDLEAEIGGIGTEMALDALDADLATRHIVLISKPPEAGVVARLVARIGASVKSFTLCLVGGEEVALPPNARQVATLAEAAGVAPDFDVQAAARTLPPGRLGARGLFCGGTLAAEAEVVFLRAGATQAMIDLGADEYTRGRPHPMIDPTGRDEMLAVALADPALGLVLLDLIIGHGAHPDPSAGIVGALDAAGANRPLVVASVTGTDQDPQGRATQVARLEAAGVLIAPSNAEAAKLALACLGAGNA